MPQDNTVVIIDLFIVGHTSIQACRAG